MCSSGCSSLTYFDLPIYQITEPPFPAVGGKIVLVNNAVEQPTHADGRIIFADNKEKHLVFERDSVTFPMLNMIGEQLLESEFIEDVLIYTTPIRKDSLYESEFILTPPQLNTIQQESGADWILSLDALPHHTEIKEKISPKFNLINTFLTIQVNPVFRLYKAGENNARKHYYLADTTSWESSQFQLELAIAALPPLKQCYQDALYFAAEKAVHRWIPYPVIEKRCWVNYPHSVMREAASFFVKGDYESAGYMWEYGYENIKNQKIRYYAAYNRAILAEIKGELDNALLWLEKATAIEPVNGSLHKLNLQQIQSSIKAQIATQFQLQTLFK